KGVVTSTPSRCSPAATATTPPPGRWRRPSRIPRRNLTDADLRAVAVYIKDLAPGGGQSPQPISAQDPAMQQGEAIYVDQCAACHTMGGGGIVGVFPRLSGAPLVQQAQATSLVRVVLQGSRAVATGGTPTGPGMPSFACELSVA